MDTREVRLCNERFTESLRDISCNKPIVSVHAGENQIRKRKYYETSCSCTTMRIDERGGFIQGNLYGKWRKMLVFNQSCIVAKLYRVQTGSYQVLLKLLPGI